MQPLASQSLLQLWNLRSRSPSTREPSLSNLNSSKAATRPSLASGTTLCSQLVLISSPLHHKAASSATFSFSTLDWTSPLNLRREPLLFRVEGALPSHRLHLLSKTLLFAVAHPPLITRACFSRLNSSHFGRALHPLYCPSDLCHPTLQRTHPSAVVLEILNPGTPKTQKEQSVESPQGRTSSWPSFDADRAFSHRESTHSVAHLDTGLC